MRDSCATEAGFLELFGEPLPTRIWIARCESPRPAAVNFPPFPPLAVVWVGTGCGDAGTAPLKFSELVVLALLVGSVSVAPPLLSASVPELSVVDTPLRVSVPAPFVVS